MMCATPFCLPSICIHNIWLIHSIFFQVTHFGWSWGQHKQRTPSGAYLHNIPTKLALDNFMIIKINWNSSSAYFVIFYNRFFFEVLQLFALWYLLWYYNTIRKHMYQCTIASYKNGSCLFYFLSFPTHIWLFLIFSQSFK